MSRSGYSFDLEPGELGRWRAQVASSIRGKRGQALLRDMKAALEAMPERCLIEGVLEHGDSVCALGAVGRMRGVGMADVEAYDRDAVGEAFNIAPQLAAEIVFENDEQLARATPEQRWEHVYRWTCQNIKGEVSDAGNVTP